jgi:hypothetical protein
MSRRFLGAMLLVVLLGGQATAIAAPLLSHSDHHCTCHQRICICKHRQRKPVQPAEPDCHESKTPASPSLNLQGCDEPDEKDLTAAPVYLLPAPIQLSGPGVALNAAFTMQPLEVAPIIEINPPPPKFLQL